MDGPRTTVLPWGAGLIPCLPPGEVNTTHTSGKRLRSEPRASHRDGSPGAVAVSIQPSTERRNMAFKAVWGFDPEEVLKEQREFQQSLTGARLRSANELDEAMNFPSSADAQIYELSWIFRL